MKSKKQNNKGITLIALAITIIVLLILAGVSIAMLTGENGLLTKANDSKKATEKAGVKETVQIEIAGSFTNDGTYDMNQAKENLKNNLGITEGAIKEPSSDTTNGAFDVTYKGIELIVKKNGEVVYKGETTPIGPSISTTESCVGKYADIDDNGTIDGIIFADLAVGSNGQKQWENSDGTYTIPKIDRGLKEYYIKEKGKVDNRFDDTPRDVIAAKGAGTDRFYIMSLEDIDLNTHTWYKNAYGNMNDYETYTSKTFGKGKENTRKMIERIDKGEVSNGGYGAENANDVWALNSLRNKVNKGWFVPSKEEWSAFAQELGINNTNYASYKLSDWYWSSSQSNNYFSWLADFSYGYMRSINVGNGNCVRLCTTF